MNSPLRKSQVSDANDQRLERKSLNDYGGEFPQVTARVSPTARTQTTTPELLTQSSNKSRAKSITKKKKAYRGI